MDKIGRYVIKKKIAEGGMATIYLAEDPAIRRDVAVKLFKKGSFGGDRKALEMVYAEAQSQGTLSHPNICVIYDTVEEQGIPSIVMEYLDGPSLATLLGQSVRFAPGEVLEIMLELCAALEYAHAKGVIHRDIKPGNIIRLKDGRIKLTDFGIAQVVGGAGRASSGRGFGTPGYMSPEQAEGGKVDHRTDVFSAGVVMYELLTGAKAFKGKTGTEYRAELSRMDMAPPSRLSPEVPAELDAIVFKAVALKPDSRYRSAAEFKRALAVARKKWAGQRAGGAVPSGPGLGVAKGEFAKSETKKLPKKRSYGVLYIGIGVIGLVVLLALGLALFQGGGPGRPSGPAAAGSAPPEAPPRAKSIDESLAEADALIAAKKVNEAALLLDGIVKAHADSFEAHFRLGRLYFEIFSPRLPTSAEISLRKAVELKPGSVEARMLLARVLESEKKYEEALQECDRIVTADPNLKNDVEGLRSKIRASLALKAPQAEKSPVTKPVVAAKPVPKAKGTLTITAVPNDVAVRIDLQSIDSKKFITQNEYLPFSNNEIDAGGYRVKFTIDVTRETHFIENYEVKAGQDNNLPIELYSRFWVHFAEGASKDFSLLIDDLPVGIPDEIRLSVGEHVFIPIREDGTRGRPEKRLVTFQGMGNQYFTWRDQEVISPVPAP